MKGVCKNVWMKSMIERVLWLTQLLCVKADRSLDIRHLSKQPLKPSHTPYTILHMLSVNSHQIAPSVPNALWMKPPGFHYLSFPIPLFNYTLPEHSIHLPSSKTFISSIFFEGLPLPNTNHHGRRSPPLLLPFAIRPITKQVKILSSK